MQIALPAKHDVGSIFGFVQAPVIQVLGHRPICQGGEGIVQQRVADLLAVQLSRQPVVPVAVELQTKGTPSGYPHLAEPQIFVEEVEIVVQAFAVVVPQIGPATVLVVHGW